MIEGLLVNGKVPYELIDEDDRFKLVKVNLKLHILYLYRKGSKFPMRRDFFDFIDGSSILCHGLLNNKPSHLKLNENINSIKPYSQTCHKSSLYLGKNVLNALICEVHYKWSY